VWKFPPALSSPPGDGPQRADIRRRLTRCRGERIAEPWRVTTLVWRALCAALLPIALRDVARVLDRYLAHLARGRSGARERSAAVFLRHLTPDRS
jgi:hypothetical protein